MRARPVSTVIIAAVAALAAVAAGPAFAADAAARVDGIAAGPSADGAAIVVTFTPSAAARDLLLFWGTSAMTSGEDLLRAAAYARLDAGTSAYAVPVPPGTTWWFAVLDAEAYRLGAASVVPGANATVAGVRAPGPATVAAPQRGSPLPALRIDRAADSGRSVEAAPAGVPAPRVVSTATARAIAALLEEAGDAPRPVLKAQVLETEAPADAGDPALRAAAQSLSAGEWAQAEKRLKDYLSIRRTGAQRARARFYLGQAYWFLGRPRDAFFEFLAAEDELPRQSRPWREACLEALAAAD